MNQNEKDSNLSLNNNQENSFQTKQKNESTFKKVILPSIKNRRNLDIPASSFHPRIKKNISHNDLFVNQKSKSNMNLYNSEIDKLMIAKVDLAHLKKKVNDLNYSYKKLCIEKDENLNILKEAISSNNYTYSESLYKKIAQILEDAINNKKNINNSKISQKTIEEKDKKKEENNNIDNENKNIDDNKENDIDENIEQDNNNNVNNKEIKNEENNRKMNEENQNDINENNFDNSNIHNNSPDMKHRHNYSLETREEDINNTKNNSINNSRLINSNNNNINNNSIEEENNIKDEKEEKDDLYKYQIESGIFEKSMIPSRFYNILKVRNELSTLKHRMIKLQQNMKFKEEEINEIKNRAKMKNIIYQSNLLGQNISELHKIKTKNKKIETISIPTKNLQYENLKKELEYYTKINKSVLSENKNANENYLTIKNEFDEKNKLCNTLLEKNNNLKYQLNSYKQNDLQKTLELRYMQQKIEEIPNVEEKIEKYKKMIRDNEKEINNLKENLNKKNEEYETSKENKNKKYEEMENYEKQMNNKINKQKNDFSKCRNDIKDLDKMISKELEMYSILYKDEEEKVHNMYSKKFQNNINEFINYIKKEQKYEEKKAKENKEERWKNLYKGKHMTYNAISKIKNKKMNKDNKDNKNEKLLLLIDKIQY